MHKLTWLVQRVDCGNLLFVGSIEADDILNTFCMNSLSGEGDDFISTWDEVHETFDVMGLHENLLRGIYAYGKLWIAIPLLRPHFISILHQLLL